MLLESIIELYQSSSTFGQKSTKSTKCLSTKMSNYSFKVLRLEERSWLFPVVAVIPPNSQSREVWAFGVDSESTVCQRRGS